MNQIRQMFQLQKQLNDETNGAIWIKGITKEGRKISWLRCIYMEAGEAIDSFNWKHWKDINLEPNLDNAKVELIDIWHFIMSEAIHLGDTTFAEVYLNIKPNQNVDTEKLVEIFEKIIALSSNANIDKSKNELYKITALFFDALVNIGMGVLELYKHYLIKNQLNTFRQNHGYKQGGYIKIWNTLEDNVVACNIMEEQPNLTPKQLYQQLEKAYKLVN